MEVYFAGKSHGYPSLFSDSGNFMKQRAGLFTGETWDGQVTLW